MNIKHVRTVTLLLMLLVGGEGMTQANGAVTGSTSELQQARALLSVERKNIVIEEMRLSEEESAAFWPVYDRFQADLQLVRNRYADLLTAYTDAYRAGTVSEAMANQIIDDFLQIQGELLHIKQEYLDDFRNALPARKAARYYQIENKIQLELESQLSMVVPLIDPV